MGTGWEENRIDKFEYGERFLLDIDCISTEEFDIIMDYIKRGKIVQIKSDEYPFKGRLFEKR